MWVTAGGEWNQPVIQPALRPSWVIQHGRRGSRGAVGEACSRGGGGRSGPRDFYEGRHARICFHTSRNAARTVELFLDCDLWPVPCGDQSVRGQSTRLAANGDYTIKLLVNLLAQNRSKCHERLLEGARPRGSLVMSVWNNNPLLRRFSLPGLFLICVFLAKWSPVSFGDEERWRRVRAGIKPQLSLGDKWG